MAANEKGEMHGKDDAYEQARFVLAKIGKALAEADAGYQDVVQTRIYITDTKHVDDIARAHGEVFGAIRPASTMVEISNLLAPGYFVEIEALAMVA